MTYGQQDRGEFDGFDLESAARRATSHVVKARARHYLRRPAAMEALYPGLSLAPTATLIAVAEHLVERERASPRRWFGFGGEISLTNAQAVLLLGRALRIRESRLRRRPRPPAGGPEPFGATKEP